MAAEMTEPRARLCGKERPYRVKGSLSGDSLAAILKGLDAEFVVDVASADVMGLTLGPRSLVVRGKTGTFTVDPIHTTLNNGRVVLLPGLVVDEVRGSPCGPRPGSKVEGAEINDEVSGAPPHLHRPGPRQATNVHGKILVCRPGRFPFDRPAHAQVSMTGKLDFQDVVFAPGPFARQVLTLVGKPNEPGLRLTARRALDPDGRVFQKGLDSPSPGGPRSRSKARSGLIESLDLKATLPITRGCSARRRGSTAW